MNDYVMTAGDVAGLLGVLAAHRVEACVGGGWGVDALLETQTRDHRDLDLWVPAEQLGEAFRAFTECGVDRILPWPGDRPWNIVLHDGVRLRVDLHLYEFLPNGSIHYGSAVDGATFPVQALDGLGIIAGKAVRCESPEWAVRWHTGYPPRPVDHHDVALLCNRFGLDRPPAFI